MTTTRTIRRSAGGLFLAAAVSIIGLASPASANSVNFGGSTADTGGAGASMLSHIITVQPSASPMSGYSSQVVSYRVWERDIDANTAWTVSDWQTPTAVSTTSWQNCDMSYLVGCFGITTTSGYQLPAYSFYGATGDAHDLWVEFAYLTGSTWSFTTQQITTCTTQYQQQGITFNWFGSYCRT